MNDIVTITAKEYRSLLKLKQDVEDSQFITGTMADIAGGAPTLDDAEMKAYLAAPTPLAYWRKRAGKTQAELATAAGVSQAFIAQIESGRRDGTVRVLARIADALDMRIDDLIE